MPEFALLAEDNCVPLGVLSFMARAIDLQMRRDVAPYFAGEAWTVSALSSLQGLREAPGVRKVLTFKRKLNVEGALGFHTDIAGVEFAEALAPNFDSKFIDGTTASHEVIETFGDPACDLSQPGPDGGEFDYELCDPCEADSYPIEVTIGSESRIVTVSDFVTPAWFNQGAGRCDFLGRIRAPFELSQGGYYRLVDKHGAEHYVFADEQARASVAAKLANTTSRVTRRARAPA